MSWYHYMNDHAFGIATYWDNPVDIAPLPYIPLIYLKQCIEKSGGEVAFLVAKQHLDLCCDPRNKEC